eukprot:45567_1
MNHIRDLIQMNSKRKKNKTKLPPNDVTTTEQKQNLLSKYVYFSKSPVHPNTIDSLIRSLPSCGSLKHYPLTSYWCISLGDSWQNQSPNIVKLSHLFIKHRTEYNQSIHKGKHWASMVDTANPTISCVTPPSVAGFHISLGSTTQNANRCLSEGELVSFRIKTIKTILTLRKGPQNIEGQFTNDEGWRFYPTLWIIADIEFIDFEFATGYPPHISLACVAVQLNVDKVAQLELNVENSESKTDE